MKEITIDEAFDKKELNLTLVKKENKDNEKTRKLVLPTNDDENNKWNENSNGNDNSVELNPNKPNESLP